MHIEAGDRIAVIEILLFRVQRDNWKLKITALDHNNEKGSSPNGTFLLNTDTTDRTKNIILVDDEPDVLYSFLISLFEEGYNVIPFSK